MTLKRVVIPSPNYSSRGGAKVTVIVLHTAEGALTYQSLGSFFANPASGVSSHAGIDDQPGVIGEYVRSDYKAWTAANANPWCVQAELCAFAAWTPADWQAHPNMLANTAAWIGEEADRFGIPIVRLSPAQAQAGGPGVCQHVDLGSMGGGHWDCGPGFPIDEVLSMASGGAALSPPGPATPAPPAGAAPPWPGRYFKYPPEMQGEDVRQWQAAIKSRGWVIGVDSWYGGQSAAVCRSFQQDSTAHGWPLDDDGIVGPETWRATWERPVT